MHRTSEPAILYFGTPVVLISSVDREGAVNLAPMSSAWWLGWRCLLGLSAASKTVENLRQSGECVLNLPSDAMAAHVDKLAKTTGSHPVPARKIERGYRFEPDKFATAGLRQQPSDLVAAPRVLECPVQMEASVEAIHGIAEEAPEVRGRSVAIETRIRRVHVEESILADRDRIDPDKWRPLIMSFQHFYGLEEGRRIDSTLARIPEIMYRSPDVGRDPLPSGR
jgi:flavin reductase (DIM6/NTAB) family NADH-FMN oxidoreductase RutF